jgi:formylglycine-generating enzyme required for sulfatase activity
LGNVGTNTWSFTLESQPQTVTNLFVFGSQQAQARGQQIGNLATRALVKSSGPVPNASGYPWTLAQVATNFLLLAYTNTTPVFTVGQYVCNLTPASPAEIFNRRITAISDDSGHKLLTLFTVEVLLTEIVTNGSASVSSDSMILQMGTNGVFAKTLSVSGTVTFPRIGYSLDGAEFKLRQNGFESTINGVTVSLGDPPDLLHLTAGQLHWWLTPSLNAGLEMSWGTLTRFQAIASGTVDQASIWDADVLLAGVYAKQTIGLPETAKPEIWLFLGSIGPVPVFASLGLNLKVELEEQAQANLSFHAGESQSVNVSFGVTYNSPGDVEWVHDFNFPSPTIDPFTANLTAEGSVKLSLEPAVKFLVYGLAGVSAGITPSAKVIFQAGTSQSLTGDLEAEVSLDLGLAGPVLEPLNLPDFSLSLWSDTWHLFPNPANTTTTGTAIIFDQQPQSQTVTTGGSAYFSCAVSSSGTPSYQWYFNGVPMAGQNSRTLSLPGVNSGYAGNYYVSVTAGGQTTNSVAATLTVLPKSVESGLVAWYPFNGNANDASGNGHDGTVIGTTLTTDRFGTPNSAYYFPGNGERISVPHADSLNLLNGYTLSTWINFEVGGLSSPRIIDKFTYSFFTLQNGSSRSLGMYFSDQTSLFTTTTISAGQWYHVVSSYDLHQRKIYVNGSLVASDSSTFALITNSLPLEIGRKPVYGYDSFKGKIDDVRIYNRALSDSEILQLYNASLPVPAPSTGMALIPAGSFTMGDSLDGDSSALPLHTVYVSAFYMDKYDVTKTLWDSVYQWAITHGYSFDYVGSGKAANHPVQTIDWYDAVKWCNARSEKENRTPAYYTSGNQTTIYKTGQLNLTNGCVNWTSGYRLPTEAEWEKAARGGASGQRFPWGNTISWSQANYNAYPLSAGGYAYDISPTRGYHPTFATGNDPYTSPVGYFSPNGYGLYDMAGNVWQWCWDWYGSYGSASQTDPRGPASGSFRVFRGGCWFSYASNCRTAYRDYYYPAGGIDVSGLGFRSVLPPGQ